MAMIETWQLQDAKNPIVNKFGVEGVVVLSVKEYRKLKQPKTDLVAFFRQSPLREMDLDPSRVKDPS